MDAQQNKRHVQEAYRLFMQGDIRGVIDHCHDEAEWISPDSDYLPFGGVFHGKQGIADYFAKLDAHAQPLRFEPQEFVAEGDKVIVLGHATWQSRATGRSFDTPWVHVFTMRDGLIGRYQAYADTAAAERAFQPEQPLQAPMGTPLHH